MGLNDSPPVPIASNSLGLAFVYANNQGHIFYYNESDEKLCMARGKEELGYEGNAIVVGENQETILFNTGSTPTPLAAGVDSNNEIHLFYVQQGGNIGELVTKDYGNTWDFGPLTHQPFIIASVGGLAAYPGDIWRVVIRMQSEENTLVELYKQGENEWAPYVIPLRDMLSIDLGCPWWKKTEWWKGMAMLFC